MKMVVMEIIFKKNPTTTTPPPFFFYSESTKIWIIRKAYVLSSKGAQCKHEVAWMSPPSKPPFSLKSQFNEILQVT